MRAAILAVALLAGCQHSPTVPLEARVLVSVPCLTRDQIPAQAFISDAALAKLADGPFVIALAQDRLAQREFIVVAAALMEACVKAQ